MYVQIINGMYMYNVIMRSKKLVNFLRDLKYLHLTYFYARRWEPSFSVLTNFDKIFEM